MSNNSTEACFILLRNLNVTLFWWNARLLHERCPSGVWFESPRNKSRGGSEACKLLHVGQSYSFIRTPQKAFNHLLQECLQHGHVYTPQVWSAELKWTLRRKSPVLILFAAEDKVQQILLTPAFCTFMRKATTQGFFSFSITAAHIILDPETCVCVLTLWSDRSVKRSTPGLSVCGDVNAVKNPDEDKTIKLPSHARVSERKVRDTLTRLWGLFCEKKRVRPALLSLWNFQSLPREKTEKVPQFYPTLGFAFCLIC